MAGHCRDRQFLNAGYRSRFSLPSYFMQHSRHKE